MYRIALKNGELTLDKDGKAIGRGVYICKDKDCIEKAKKKMDYSEVLGVTFR